MRTRIKSLIKEPIVIGSFWVTAGNFLVSAGNYLFNLLMGRMLLPSGYGSLASLISLSIIISLPAGVITTIVTKFSAEFFTKEEYVKIARLVKRFTIYTLIGGVAMIVFFIASSSFIQNFLKIYEVKLVILTGIMVALGLIGSINRGLLQGFLYFKFLALLGVLAVIIKLVVGWYLVSKGFLVFGALLALVIAALLSWFISFWPVRNVYLINAGKSVGIRKRIFDFSLPSFSLTTMTMLFLSSDILLVKHFFNADAAGIYAAVSVVGKVIFYVIGPISTVFFPIVAQKFAQGNQWIRELIQGLLLVSIPGIIGVLIYFLYPDVVLKIFFPKKEYYQAASFIGLYSIYMLLFSLASLLTNFYLAIEREKLTYIALFGALLQILLITIFHDTISKVIWMSIVSTGLIIIIQSIYLGKLLLSYGKV